MKATMRTTGRSSLCQAEANGRSVFQRQGAWGAQARRSMRPLLNAFTPQRIQPYGWVNPGSSTPPPMTMPFHWWSRGPIPEIPVPALNRPFVRRKNSPIEGSLPSFPGVATARCPKKSCSFLNSHPHGGDDDPARIAGHPAEGLSMPFARRRGSRIAARFPVPRKPGTVNCWSGREWKCSGSKC